MPNTANTIVRHHLLELILWPKDDGSFIEINNSAKRLKELGIYDDFKLTIQMTSSEHTTFHNKARKNNYWRGKHPSEATRKKISESLKGKTFTAEHRQKLSVANKGKTRSEATRQRIAAAKTEYWRKRKRA